MTVKAVRGRRRYVAFDVSPGMTSAKLSFLIPKRFRVIQCAEGMAIVRCGDDVDDCIEAVRTADPGSCSRRTSGTLKTLRDRYRVLRENKPPRPSRTGVRRTRENSDATSIKNP